LGSSQSRVATVEAGADSVSLDLLIRSYFAMAATADDWAKVVGSSKRVQGYDVNEQSGAPFAATPLMRSAAINSRRVFSYQTGGLVLLSSEVFSVEGLLCWSVPIRPLESHPTPQACHISVEKKEK
jgi:hypothetical protein